MKRYRQASTFAWFVMKSFLLCILILGGAMTSQAERRSASQLRAEAQGVFGVLKPSQVEEIDFPKWSR